MEKNHFKQALVWLKCAEYASDLDEDTNKYNVAVAMSVHSIIKANDALTFKFMNITARKHDDAKRLFQDMIKRKFIHEKYSSYKDIIQDAIYGKAKAEYLCSYFSKRDYEEMHRKADKFVEMAKQIV